MQFNLADVLSYFAQRQQRMSASIVRFRAFGYQEDKGRRITSRAHKMVNLSKR
jgi:hypothetical protein